MKKIVRITESEITNIVSKVIKESNWFDHPGTREYEEKQEEMDIFAREIKKSKDTKEEVSSEDVELSNNFVSDDADYDKVLDMLTKIEKGYKETLKTSDLRKLKELMKNEKLTYGEALEKLGFTKRYN
tara:strand:+ start:306 stop:689 length:384 start_codon:yes stop_codon:yes gene_type:complete